MKFSQIYSVYPELSKFGKDNATVTGVSRSNQNFQSGNIFVAIPGTSWDGHTFALNAAKAGASLVVVERPEIFEQMDGVAKLLVSDTREALARLSAWWNGNPSEKLFTIGITGTNGKTTTSFLIEHLLNQHKKDCAVIGTIDHHFLQKKWKTELTSPGPQELQARLKEFVELKAKSVVMETSSHAIDQKRVSAVQFDVGVFTNLTQDHLDYHKTMDNYFLAKEKLFTELLAQSKKSEKWAILNSDDEYSMKIQVPAKVRVLKIGKQNADFLFSNFRFSFENTTFHLKTPSGDFFVDIPLAGEHNIYNATTALAVAYTAGIPLKEAVPALKKFNGVPGRLQFVPNTKGLRVFVDFAHTPDALERVLLFLNSIRASTQEKNKIITVFGAGGNRDPLKRPIMGKIANQYSDRIYVTSDNPRLEEPEKIVNDILAGITDSSRAKKIVDRKLAIYKALEEAQKGDVVLIAGKGHEQYQEVMNVKQFFDDVETVKNFFKEKR